MEKSKLEKYREERARHLETVSYTHLMEELTLPPPVFRESRGSFVVTLISEPIQSEKACSCLLYTSRCV